MLGRFQRVLHRGVLAGLQQQHQQQCQQLEVLGLQAARSYFNGKGTSSDSSWVACSKHIACSMANVVCAGSFS
jgi:hypothetical protein